jgi:hypothetical protein
MRYIFILLFFTSCVSLKTSAIPDVIDLSKITDRYIDLSLFPFDTVRVIGKYQGDRIVLKNAQNIVLDFDARIESTHTEDAIAFLGPVTNVSMIGKLIVNNSITFWDLLTNVEITGIVSRGAHTGIRATQPMPHSFVNIHHNLISKTGFEGIYIGPSYSTQNKLRQVRIHENKVVHTGWDNIQIGNCEDCFIEANLILDSATKNEYGQNYAITINPGSRAYLRGNTLINCKQKIQVLDSRAFWF